VVDQPEIMRHQVIGEGAHDLPHPLLLCIGLGDQVVVPAEEEIVPIPVSQKGEQTMLDTDETPRRDTSLEKLAKLRTVYPDGVCTAGNSSSENDGAGALVLTTTEKAKEHKVEPMAYLKSFAIAGADPSLTYPSVPAAVNKALKKAGLTIDEIDFIEIQEAFAVQTLADAKLMGIRKEDLDKVPRPGKETANVDALLKLSAKADQVLAEVWDNDKDAAYDRV